MQRPKNKLPKNDGVLLEVLPGQAKVCEEWHQPLWGTMGAGSGVVLVGSSPQGSALPFAGMGNDQESERRAMQETHLKRVHLSRLSPVMWAWQDGYPRKELGVPISPAYGMGNYETQAPYEQATGINPKGSPVWSNLYRIGAAGALSRVRPFGPDAFSGCGCGVGTEGETESSGSALSKLWPFFLAFAGFGLLSYLGSRRA